MTLTARLAAHFAAHPNHWLDGQDLAKVAGSYAWRTRASELRKPPYGMTIENRVRTLRSLTGKTYRVSEYRYLKGCILANCSMLLSAMRFAVNS